MATADENLLAIQGESYSNMLSSLHDNVLSKICWDLYLREIEINI